SAIRRMAMGRIAGDEHAADLILLGDGDAQIPEPHIIELAGKLESRGALQQAVEVVVVRGRVGRDRSVKEKSLADVDAAEELTIALQIRVHGAIGGARGKPLQSLVELARSEHGEYHELVEIGAAALDAELTADGGVVPVAPHHVLRFEDVSPAAGFLDDGDTCAFVILLDR